MHYNKVFLAIASASFSAISCKNDGTHNNQLNLEEYQIAFTSPKDPVNMTLVKGSVKCGKYENEFELNGSSTQIYVAKDHLCAITITNIEFTKNSKNYNLSPKDTNKPILIQYNSQDIQRQENIFFNNKSDEFSVHTEIDTPNKKIDILFYFFNVFQPLSAYTLEPISNIYFNAIEAPKNIDLYATILKQTVPLKSNYWLKTNDQSQLPNAKHCAVVSQTDLENYFTKLKINKQKTDDWITLSWQDIRSYFKSESLIKSDCPEFYQRTMDFSSPGNWNSFANSKHFIIISTDPINNEYNSYRVIKVNELNN
ncbi:hypothetical protein [Spirobacillus cienkowskii]|uniref:hypothetical protein n=1 Tax=Spirobacillus cienkowskii TaxID=495820 RepID=UPI0030CD88D3